MDENPDSNFESTLCGILKRARAPGYRNREWSEIDGDLRRAMRRFVLTLRADVRYEHKEEDSIESELVGAWMRYRDCFPRPKLRSFASEVLKGLSGQPVIREVFLGTVGITVPHGLSVADVTFLNVDSVDLPLEFKPLAQGTMVCSVHVTAGTDELVGARAKRAAARALALVRQTATNSLRWKLNLRQRLFGLNGACTWSRGESGQRYAIETAITLVPLDLRSEPRWLDEANRVSKLRSDLSSPIRARFDTALDWLDIASLSDNWRVRIPCLFSAIECLIVLESSGLKSGLVVVRSIGLLMETHGGVQDPTIIARSYELRNQLVHGGLTAHLEESQLADDRGNWAYSVLAAYAGLAVQSKLADPREITAHIDAYVTEDLLQWIEMWGLGDAVDEYRRSVAT